MSERELPYGHKLPYWKTSQSSPDRWCEKTAAIISKLGGTDIGQMFATMNGRGTFVLSFRFGGRLYRVIWPIMRHRDGEERAARIQAATLMYHDCKSKAVSAAALGVDIAFAGQRVLANDKTVAECSADYLLEHSTQLALPNP